MPQGLGGYALLKGRGCGMLGQGPKGNIHPCRMGKKLCQMQQVGRRSEKELMDAKEKCGASPACNCSQENVWCVQEVGVVPCGEMEPEGTSAPKSWIWKNSLLLCWKLRPQSKDPSR